MIDQEAQRITARCICTYCGGSWKDASDIFTAQATELLNKLEEIGYRRLPQCEPPLLGKSEEVKK